MRSHHPAARKATAVGTSHQALINTALSYFGCTGITAGETMVGADTDCLPTNATPRLTTRDATASMVAAVALMPLLFPSPRSRRELMRSIFSSMFALLDAT